jgi:hypothetical protein
MAPATVRQHVGGALLDRAAQHPARVARHVLPPTPGGNPMPKAARAGLVSNAGLPEPDAELAALRAAGPSGRGHRLAGRGGGRQPPQRRVAGLADPATQPLITD